MPFILHDAPNRYSNSEREHYAIVKRLAQVRWLLMGSETHNSTTRFSCAEMSWHLPFSGHWAFIAMIVYFVTLAATILLGGAHSGGLISCSKEKF